MPMNRIQFQPGVSMPQFFARYGSEHLGVGDRGAPNEVPIVAVVSTNDAG